MNNGINFDVSRTQNEDIKENIVDFICFGDSMYPNRLFICLK